MDGDKSAAVRPLPKPVNRHGNSFTSSARDGCAWGPWGCAFLGLGMTPSLYGILWPPVAARAGRVLGLYRECWALC